MPQFRNTASLMEYIKKAVDVALTADVYPTVRDEEVEAIDEVVYSYPTSDYYRRRGDSGGLGDRTNIIIKGGAAVDGVLTVVNIARPNPYLNGVDASGGMASVDKDLPSTVESGYGYDYWPSPKARKFTEKTIQKLSASGACTTALKVGLRSQGITVR